MKAKPSSAKMYPSFENVPNRVVAPRLAVLALLSFLLASCASTERSASGKWTPEIKPGLIMVTPDQAALHGIALKTPPTPPPKNAKGLDSSAVLTGPEVHAYTVGRYADPADSDLMHEAHVVYRKESAPAWRLDVAPGKQILVGPTLTDRNPAAGPLQDKELTQFLTEMARANRENRQAIELLYKAVETLSKQQGQGASPPTDASAPRVPAAEKS